MWRKQNSYRSYKTELRHQEDIKLRSVLDILMDFKHCKSNIITFSEQKTALKPVLWSIYDQEVNIYFELFSQ